MIALPHTPGRLSEAAWTERVRGALGDLSDQVFVLLGAFEVAVVEDELADGGPRTVALTSRVLAERAVGASRVRDVEVLRDRAASSRWWLYTGRVPGTERLDGEVAVAVRLVTVDGVLRPALPTDVGGGAPFHLFFPTQIPTGLPFLLHAYFEVDAGRKAFAEDEGVHNAERLLALRQLLTEVVGDLCAAEDRGDLDLGALPELFAAADAPIEDASARAFREAALAALDELSWVRARSEDKGVVRVAPKRVLAVVDAGLAARFVEAFPPGYLAKQVEGAYPLAAVSDRARTWLAARSGLTPLGCLPRLLRPDAVEPWIEPDHGFLALLDVLKVLEANHAAAMKPVLDGLAADPAARLVPVASSGGTVRLRPVSRQEIADDPDLEEAADRAVFARLKGGRGDPLLPPACLSLAFVRDGVLDEDRLRGMARRLGVREYVTRDILDHVGGVRKASWGNDEWLACARFVWRLLLRERESEHSVSAERLASFLPGEFAWCRPGRVGSARIDERRTQARARRLARTRIPNQDGEWRPAETLAFGDEWAQFFATNTELPPCAAAERVAAYHDLALLAPPGALVASPETLSVLFPLAEEDLAWTTDAPALAELSPPLRHGLAVFLWLQRLGVWEIPPVVFRASGKDDPLMAADVEPAAWWREVSKASGSFTTYQHQNVRIAENFRLGWPLRGGDPVQLRALSRGFAWYATLGKTSLFCSRCKSHGTRYSNLATEGPSTLLWQLRNDPWVPVTLGGEPATAAVPSAAWWEPEAPTGTAFQQSWLRFLPLAPATAPEAMARALGFAGRAGTSLAQIHAALRALRQRHEAGPLWRDDKDRPNARQAFVATHVRLYELLKWHPPADVARVIADGEVLVELGSQLTWRPAVEARHDDGSCAGYRRHFAGDLPFLVVPRRETALAKAIGVQPFTIKLERVPRDGESLTAPASPAWLRELLPEILAILVFVPVSGDALAPGSVQFLARARRLGALQIGWVSNLIQRVVVDGRADLEREIGEDLWGEVFLEGAGSTRPVLWHDYTPEDADASLRAHLGAVVAALLESPPHADTLTLYFQLGGEAARGGFLLDRGIGSDEMRAVRDALHAAGLIARDEERRWWRALLGMLGEPGELPEDEGLSAFVHEALARAPIDAATRHTVERAGGTAEVRTDPSVTGPLSALEQEGIDLHALHQRLRALGDEGIDLRVARDRLRQWRTAHGMSVAVVLHALGMAPHLATRAPDRWTAPPALAWRTDPPLDAVLAPVLADLRERGLVPDGARLAGPDPARHLAELAGLSVEGLAAAVHTLTAPEEAIERAKLLAHRWRSALLPVLVALRARPGEPGFRIREDAKRVEEVLPAPRRIADLARPARLLLSNHPALAEALVAVLSAGERDQAEPVDIGAALPAGSLEAAHLAAVRRELDVARRGRSHSLRAARDKLRAAKITPTPPPSLGTPPERKPRAPGTRDIPIGSARKNAHRLDALGRAGEAWAIAAILDPILALDVLERGHVVATLLQALKDAYKGPAVERLTGHAGAAAAVVDDDEEFVLALVDFLHLSATSDWFGCDLLGWLPRAPGAPARPMFLEAKSYKDRSFPVSSNEWNEAGRLGADYAFLVVLRAPKADSAPLGMELLVDPAGLLAAKPPQLALEADGHVVRYRLAPEKA